MVNAVRLFDEWCRRAPSDDNWMARFKVVPQGNNLAEIGLPSWISNYNGKPFLIKRPGTTGFLYRHPDKSCMEFDVSLHPFPYLAKQGICYMKDGFFKRILATLAFCIEGRADDELPECLIGLYQLVSIRKQKQTSIALCISIPKILIRSLTICLCIINAFRFPVLSQPNPRHTGGRLFCRKKRAIEIRQHYIERTDRSKLQSTATLEPSKITISLQQKIHGTLHRPPFRSSAMFPVPKNVHGFQNSNFKSLLLFLYRSMLVQSLHVPTPLQ
jgi:hypothetical protein